MQINILLMPLIMVFVLIPIIFKTIKAGNGRSYYTNQFRGKAQDSIRLTNTSLTGKELCSTIKLAMEEKIKENKIPAKIVFAAVSSRKFFAIDWKPMLVIKNTEPENKYFDIGIVVNYNTITFPLLGESKENTRNNMHDMYKNERTFSGDVKSMFYRADEFKLQNEANWQQDVLDCFNEFIVT